MLTVLNAPNIDLSSRYNFFLVLHWHHSTNSHRVGYILIQVHFLDHRAVYMVQSSLILIENPVMQGVQGTDSCWENTYATTMFWSLLCSCSFCGPTCGAGTRVGQENSPCFFFFFTVSAIWTFRVQMIFTEFHKKTKQETTTVGWFFEVFLKIKQCLCSRSLMTRIRDW